MPCVLVLAYTAYNSPITDGLFEVTQLTWMFTQIQIDSIVAATPSTPTHIGGGAGPSSSSAAHGQRRTKIYCDKWVHEGVCAFTQQGCKYKHEMPSDKLTQHQLGLFHGYPQWWKKHQADLSRQREPPLSESPQNRGPGNESRLSNGRYLGRSGSSTMGSGGGGARGGGGGGMGLSSDAGGQLAWRHSGEYGGGGGESQPLGPASSIGRTTTTTSRGASGTMRTPICTYLFQPHPV